MDEIDHDPTDDAEIIQGGNLGSPDEEKDEDPRQPGTEEITNFHPHAQRYIDMKGLDQAIIQFRSKLIEAKVEHFLNIRELMDYPANMKNQKHPENTKAEVLRLQKIISFLVEIGLNLEADETETREFPAPSNLEVL